MKQFSRWLITFACLLGGLPLSASSAYALDAVTLQLKWTHAFQFAGYYAAKELGYYREAGLDVRIDEALPGGDPIKTVLEGKAEFGVGTSALLLERNAGKPVVALAVIFQHSPYVLIARQQNNDAQTIHDLIGKRVMLEPQSNELLAYFKREGISLNHITQLEHSYDPQDLIDGKTDAISAYVTNQPYYLDRAHFAYQIYTPRSAGIDFYGDNLFTTEQELRVHPERVKAFRAASLRGWQYAMEHPEEIIDLILAKYSQRHTRDYFLFEAKQMIPLLRPEMIEIGYMYSGRWRHMAETYADIGMLPHNFPLNGFLYDPNPKLDLTWLDRSLAAILLLAGIVSAVALYIVRNNRRLVRSLTERKRIEERLRKLSHAVEQSPAATAITDTHGRFEYVNPKFLEVTGYTQEELIGKTPSIIKSGLTLPDVYEDIWHTILSGREWRGEVQNSRKNGELYWEYEAISPLKNEQGEIVNFIAVKEDITERKRAEEAVRINALKHQLLFESSRDALMTLAPPSWKFTGANQATVQLFGSSSVAEFIALGPWEVSPEQQPDGRLSSEKAQEMIATAMREGSHFFEWEHQRLDGQPFAADVLLTRMKVGEDVFLQASVRDITERKRAEEALQQEHAKLLKTERELLKAYESLAEADRLESAGRLAAGVAHEVKNPLTIIRLGVDYLAKQFSQKSNKEVLDDVRGAIDRADNVIKDLLDLSRQQSFVRRPININQVIDNALRFIKHKIERRNIAIVRSRNDPMPLIYADPDRLVQVFINLLSNAAQAIGQDGSIEIVTRSICLSERDVELPGTGAFRIGEQVVAVEIRDNGPGFPAEYEKKLFEPFFTTKPMGEGSGLGLAVSRSIVIMHRGSISISNLPSGGASALLMFRVYREHLKNE